MAALPLSLVGALLLLYAHALPARSQSRPLTLQKHFQKVAPDPRQLPRSFFDVTHFAKCPKNHYRLVLKWQGVKGCVRCPAGRTRAADDLERGKRGVGAGVGHAQGRTSCCFTQRVAGLAPTAGTIIRWSRHCMTPYSHELHVLHGVT